MTDLERIMSERAIAARNAAASAQDVDHTPPVDALPTLTHRNAMGRNLLHVTQGWVTGPESARTLATYLHQWADAQELDAAK